MFFDVKPNGDVWICQDVPAATPINILDVGFTAAYRKANVSHRRKCSGCTYSCYLVTQKGFEIRNWRDMAGLWWKSNTSPGERCRAVADRYGWLAGLVSFGFDRLRRAIPTRAAGPGDTRRAVTAML
jgi:hypothetical protein